MVISRWSVQEVREGGQGALEEVGSVSALLFWGPWAWGQGTDPSILRWVRGWWLLGERA